MSKYRFFSNTNFAHFCESMEMLGADETVMENDDLALTVEISDDWDIEADDNCRMWGGEEEW